MHSSLSSTSTGVITDDEIGGVMRLRSEQREGTVPHSAMVAAKRSKRQ